ncbi:hypothetical protein [Leifsonia poae]|uniref:hypothetical protein n=1 Tax=Leifsonia poae TaxID=110933 RepID=UPI003D669E27
MIDDTPIAYTALEKGAAVLTAHGTRIGTVEHVLQDPSLDLFDGLAISTDHGLRFVDAAQVDRITADVVRTTLTDEDASTLPEPEGDEVFDADPDQYDGPGLSAWFGRMFKREHWNRREE